MFYKNSSEMFMKISENKIHSRFMNSFLDLESMLIYEFSIDKQGF